MSNVLIMITRLSVTRFNDMLYRRILQCLRGGDFTRLCQVFQTDLMIARLFYNDYETEVL